MSLTFFMSFAIYLNRAPLPAPRPPTYTLRAHLKTSKNFTYNPLYTHDKGLLVSQEAQTKT